MSEFYISKHCWDKIQGYASIAHTKHKAEIGGMMIMTKDKDNDFVMSHPTILEQTISGGQCDLDKEALALYYNNSFAKHGSNIRFVWWHSHHTMAAFWSGTDTATIEGTASADFTVSLVINLKEEYKLRVQYFEPVMSHEDVELIIMGNDKIITEDMESEVKALCSMTKVTHYKHTSYNHGYGYNTYVGGMKQTTLLPEPDVMEPEYNPNSVDLERLLGAVDTNLGRFATGEYSYTQWLSQTKGLNVQMEHTDFHCVLFKKKKLEKSMMTMGPVDMVTYQNQPLATTELLDSTQDDIFDGFSGGYTFL